jgi:chromatin structure-remodeling complex subunit RSC1/2
MARAKGPRYSLAYLQFLAAKRKREDANQTAGDGDGRHAGENEPVTKRMRRLYYPQSVTEITRQVLSEVGDEGAMNL